MGASNIIKVMCADDHPLMRDGIASALHAQSDMQMIAEASNGREAVKAFRQHRPDVTLMDLRMPEMNGIDATAAILQEFPHARVVILTTYPGDVSASRALKSGALGYLLKKTLRNELVNAVRRIHAGYRHISPEIADEIAAHVSSDNLSIHCECISDSCEAFIAFGTSQVVQEFLGSFTSRRPMPDRAAHSFAFLPPMLASVAARS
jgi:DNA-binding NarL/FixJ family response regulator